MQDFLKQYKLLILIGGIFLFVLFVIILFRTRREYTVQEALYDTQRGELFIVRSDGKEIETEIELNKDDRLFRTQDFFIHTFLKEGDFKTTIYSVTTEGLSQEDSLEGSLLYYKSQDNFIVNKKNQTEVVENGKKNSLDIVCRYASFFDDQLLCVNQSGKLLYGDSNNLEAATLPQYSSDSESYERNVIMIKEDKYRNRLYIATATVSNTPVNEIHVLANLNQILGGDESYERYIINEAPRLLTVQEDRVILNTLKRSVEGDKGDISDGTYNRYVLDNGLKPLSGYRYPLLIVW
jgi:hypothetical protein